MKVMIPGALHSYTEAAWVEASGATLGAVLDDLDRQYPGIRFRMVDEQQRVRRHVRMFVGGDQIVDLTRALRPTDELVIVQALSGG